MRDDHHLDAKRIELVVLSHSLIHDHIPSERASMAAFALEVAECCERGNMTTAAAMATELNRPKRRRKEGARHETRFVRLQRGWNECYGNVGPQGSLISVMTAP